MPILAIGTRLTPDQGPIIIWGHRKSQSLCSRGFSLIELLVAVFVIVLLTGVVCLHINHNENKMFEM